MKKVLLYDMEASEQLTLLEEETKYRTRRIELTANAVAHP